MILIEGVWILIDDKSIRVPESRDTQYSPKAAVVLEAIAKSGNGLITPDGYNPPCISAS